MMTRTGTVLFALLLTLAGCQGRRGEPAATTLAGQWAGDATVIVQWAQQKTLPLRLTIADDGSVSGTVGDATLVDARLVPPQGPRQYRIHGKLQGALIESEGITRDAANIIFDEREGALVGGVHSSGSKFGGKETMILSAGNMRLQRASGAVQ